MGGGGCREGLGLLEDQAMPSLRDVAHDCVLCIFYFVIDQSHWGK